MTRRLPFKRWLGTISLVSIVFLLNMTAVAGESYLGLGGGITYAPDQHLSESDGLLDYDVGFRVGTLVYGRRFANNLVAELEISYRRNELELLSFNGGQEVIQSDNQDVIQALAFMANVAYEFELQLPVRPYVGAGLGPAEVFLDILEQRNPVKIVNDEVTTLAYQLYAGLLIDLGERWQIAADYRWWQTAEFDMKTGTGETLSLDYTSRVFNLSFRRLLNDARNPPAIDLPAQTSRWYLNAGLGTAIAADSDISNHVDTNLDGFDLGPVLSLAAGYAYVRPSGRQLRFEVEAMGWANDADIIDFGKIVGERPLSGEVKVRSLAANLLYDFAPSWKIRPYAGLGVGYADVDYDVTLHTTTGEVQYVKDDHTGLAAQALLGFGLRLTRRIELSLNYHYWWAPSVKLEDPSGEPLETEHAAHLLLFGVRFALGG